MMSNVLAVVQKPNANFQNPGTIIIVVIVIIIILVANTIFTNKK